MAGDDVHWSPRLLATLEFATAYDLTLITLGIGVLTVATLLRQLDGRILSFPIVPVALGMLVWSVPWDLPVVSPLRQGSITLHLTELGVIVSLMGVGLKIDRLPRPSTWSSTWRLLAVTMPLTIGAVALLGWWAMGLAPAAALLLGAVLAPTDPVLAADVQVGEPLETLVKVPDTEGDTPPGDRADEAQGRNGEAADEVEHELRFALTSEAGLNDALAFPFTYLALLVADQGLHPRAWWTEWLLEDVLYRLAVGAGIGVAGGLLLGRVLLSLPRDSERDRGMTGAGALAATLLLYGVTEAASGYGFLAVFIGAIVIRHRETTNDAHVSLHVFAEQVEQLLMATILIAFGGAVATGLLGELTLPAAMLALVTVLVIRPAAGMLALVGSRRLTMRDRALASFFGVRGIGSFFYLAYALDEMNFVEAPVLWSTTAAVVLLSIVLHGTTAGPLMAWRDRAGPG